MSSEPKIVPPEISKKLAEIALGASNPSTQVILVGDNNHFRATETIGAILNQSFWDEIKKTGKKPVFATEKMLHEHQPLIDALAQGKISKSDFVEAFSGGTGQVNEREREIIFSKIADLIKSDVKVVGINNLHGMVEGGEDRVKAFIKSQELDVGIHLDWISYWKKNKSRFDADPNGEASNLLNNANDQIEKTVGPYQKRELIEVIANLNSKLEKNEVIYGGDIKDILYAMHPHSNEALANRGVLKQFVDLGDRISKDDEVVRLIQKEDSDPNALVVVSYGGGHIAGLYKQLERAGVNTTPPIMPYLGEDHFKCMKPEDLACRQTEGIAGDLQGVLNNQFKDIPQIKIPNIYDLKP